MYQNNIFAQKGDEETMELGFISALKQGEIHEFPFRGFTVRRVGGSVEVADKRTGPLGGYLLLESASIGQIHDWLKAKAQYYNE